MEIKSSYDVDFAGIMDKLRILEEQKDVSLSMCPNCHLKMLPVKQEKGKTKCFNCGHEVFVEKCSACGDYLFTDGLMGDICDRCNTPDEETIEEANRGLKELYEEFDQVRKDFPAQKFD